SLLVQQVSVGNVQLSSDLFTSVNKLVRLNLTAWVRTATDQYTDSNAILKWYNAGYNAQDKVMTLDSFVYHPLRSRESVMTSTPYQTDYITFQSGPLKFTGFDLERYNKDSVFIANAINIYRPVITVYRDKRPP